MTNPLGAKPSVDTSEFKSAIRSMNTDLRVLESGFRATAAGLSDWTKDATTLEARMKTLNSQIDIQKQKVALTRAEYERIAAEKGKTSDAARALEIQLNKENQRLNEMESELGQTDSSLQQFKTANNQAGSSVENLGNDVASTETKMITFGDVMTGMAGIVQTAVLGMITVIGTLVVAIGGVGLAIGKMVFSASDAAGKLTDISTQIGISTTRLQEFQYIGDQVGVTLDTISGAQARLVRSMATAQDQQAKFDEQLDNGVMEDQIKVPVDMAAAFNQLGVSFVDSSGHLRDQQAVFNDLIDALGKVQNPAERDALAMKLFGKSAQELNPLIKTGAKGLAEMAQQAHDVGAVMSEDTVAGLDNFGDTMANIQNAIKGVLGTLAAQFLPIFQKVADNLQNLFKSEQFKRTLAELTQILSNFATVAASVLDKLFSGDYKGALAEVFGADNAASILSFINTIRNFIFDTLIPFATQHAAEIKAALIGIGAVLGGAVIVTAISAIVAALSGIGGIIALIVAAVGVLSAAWAGNWGGIRDTVTQIWENNLKPALESLWQVLSGTLLPAIQYLWTYISTNLFPLLQALGAFISAVFNLYLRVMAGLWQNEVLPAIQVVWNFLSTYLFPLLQALGSFIGAVFNLALRVMTGLWQNELLPALQDIYGWMNDNIFPIFRTIGDYLANTFGPIIQDIAGFFSNNLSPALGGINDMIKDAIDWLYQMTDALNNIQLPDWLTPGSPTPWEIGLIGINRAMRDLNQELPAMAKNLNLQPNGLPLGLSSVKNSTNNNVQVIGNVVIRGDTTAGSLGAALKGRAY